MGGGCPPERRGVRTSSGVGPTNPPTPYNPPTPPLQRGVWDPHVLKGWHDPSPTQLSSITGWLATRHPDTFPDMTVSRATHNTTRPEPHTMQRVQSRTQHNTSRDVHNTKMSCHGLRQAPHNSHDRFRGAPPPQQRRSLGSFCPPPVSGLRKKTGAIANSHGGPSSAQRPSPALAPSSDPPTAPS